MLTFSGTVRTDGGGEVAVEFDALSWGDAIHTLHARFGPDPMFDLRLDPASVIG
jgi:hypothetical protein